MKSRIESRTPKVLQERNLKEVHYKILQAIQEEGVEANNIRIAERIGKATSTVSSHLSNLSFSGYIQKRSDGMNNFYEILQRGYHALRGKGSDSELKDRAHDIVLTFQIKRPPKTPLDSSKFIVNKSMRNWGKQLSRHENSNIVIHINGQS